MLRVANASRFRCPPPSPPAEQALDSDFEPAGQAGSMASGPSRPAPGTTEGAAVAATTVEGDADAAASTQADGSAEAQHVSGVQQQQQQEQQLKERLAVEQPAMSSLDSGT